MARCYPQRQFALIFLLPVILLGILFLYAANNQRGLHSSPFNPQLDKVGGNDEWRRAFYKPNTYKDEADMESVELEMHKRRWKMKRICHQLRRNSHTHKKLNYRQLEHIIVDDRHKLLYCYVPKVACTNWKRVLMILQTKPKVPEVHSLDKNPLDILANESHSPKVFRTLDKYTLHQIQYRLRHYYKFMFVRHPFERLLSAYRNKFQQKYSVYFHKHFGRLIIQRHRLNATQEAMDKGADVTFNEFVDYLLDKRTAEDGLFNEHWRSMESLCHPCFVHYDAIGKYEHLQADANYILDKINAKNLVKFPKINRTVDTLTLVDDYFNNITTSQISRLYHLYSLDFKMFGYKYSPLDVT